MRPVQIFIQLQFGPEKFESNNLGNILRIFKRSQDLYQYS